MSYAGLWKTSLKLSHHNSLVLGVHFGKSKEKSLELQWFDNTRKETQSQNLKDSDEMMRDNFLEVGK